MKHGFLLAVLSLSLSAQAANHSATLSWMDTQNPAGTTYNVYRATGLCSGTPAFSKLATAIVPMTYVDTTVTPGNYCYGVTAVSNGVESSMSTSAAAAVPSFAPSALVTATQ
jgi:fibronectin type 3 domain-containing protein